MVQLESKVQTRSNPHERESSKGLPFLGLRIGSQKIKCGIGREIFLNVISYFYRIIYYIYIGSSGQNV